jgi:hypothetical protein
MSKDGTEAGVARCFFDCTNRECAGSFVVRPVTYRDLDAVEGFKRSTYLV